MVTVTKQSNKSDIAKSKGVLDRIGPIGFSETDGIKILIYGMSGSGKTTLWATFPKPILALICSGSDKPGELRSVNTAEYRKTIKQVVLHNSQELLEIVKAIKQGRLTFNTVVLDHITGFQDMVLKELLGLDDIPVQKSWGLTTQQVWGQVGIQVKELLKSLLSLDQNAVMIAQERIFNNEDTEGNELIAPTIGAALMPTLTNWLNTAVEYIVHTEKRQKERVVKNTIGTGKTQKVVETREKLKGIDYCLLTGPHAVYQTKFRVPKGSPLPEYIVDADYNKIMSLINGQLK